MCVREECFMELKPLISEAMVTLKKACVANANAEISYFDVKELNEQESYYRKRCLELIATYKIWLKNAEKRRDTRITAYTQLEGKALRNTMEDYLAVYKTIKAERLFLTEIYLRQIGAGA